MSLPELILVSPCSQSFKPIGNLTEPSKVEYGQRWNVPILFPDTPNAATSHGWDRIDIIQERLRECQWLLFIGADAMIINQRIDPRSYFGDYDIGAAWDFNGYQGDIVFFRNCQEVHAVLDTVRERRMTDFDLPWLAGSEQGCLVRTLAGLPRYINALPTSELQHGGVRVKEHPKSINRHVSDYEPNDWIFHAANMNEADRIFYITAFQKQILR